MKYDFSHIFWSRVKRGKKSECWEWQSSCNNTGYGTVAVGAKTYTAHRVAAFICGIISYIAAPISKQSKEFVLHTCDNRKCCNPYHFFLGSYSDNQLDAYKKKRRSQPKGNKHRNAKLTNKQVEIIRKRYAKGNVFQRELAKEFGVSQRAISLITRNETYQ